MKKLARLLIGISLLIGCGHRLPADVHIGTSQALILSPSENRLYVFDLLLNRVSNEIKTGQLPTDLALDKNDQQILVTNQLANSISVYQRTDAKTITLVATIGTSTHPQKVIFNPVFSEAYVTFESDPNILVLDIKSVWRTPELKQMIRLSGKGNLNAFAVSSDGNTLYANAQADSKLHIIHRENDTFSLSQSVDLGTEKKVTDLLLHDKQLFLSDQAQDQVHVLNTDKNTLEKSISLKGNSTGEHPIFPGKMAMNPAGSKLYVADNGTASVSVVDVAQQKLIQTIPLSSDSSRDSFAPVGIDVSADNSRVYVTDQAGRNISIIQASAEPTSEDKLLRNIGTEASAGFLEPLGEIKIIGSPN